MASYDRDDLAAIIEGAITTSHGFDSSGSAETMRKAMNAYLGKPLGNEQFGRSKQQSLDVADMVNAACAQLSPMLSTDCMVVFEPNGQDDEEQAQAESNALNKVIMEDNQGYLKFTTSIKDALLLRKGILKVTVEEIETVEPVEYDNPTDEELAYIQTEVMQPNQVLELIGKPKGGKQKGRIITTKRLFKLKSVDPINFLYDRNHTGMNVQDCAFTAERIFPTRSDLIDQYGIEKAVVDELPVGQATQPNKVWRDDADEFMEAYTRQVERIECYECYPLLCLDDTGIASRYKVLYCNKRILDIEEYPWTPFAVGTALIYPHELEGESLFDRIYPVQLSKTFTLRQWADNLASMNNSRMGVVEGQVNMDDLVRGIPGGGVRIRNPNALVPIPVPDMGTSAVAALEYQDKLRMERGGASLDMQAPEFQVMGDTAHGIERQYSSKELTVQQMGKILAETMVRQVYLLMHQALRKWSNEPLAVKVRGNWQQVDPSQWPERTQLNVTVGQTIGQRNAAQQALMTFIQLGTQALSNGLGGQIVDLGGIYKAMGDWLKMAGVDNPDQYLIDPSSPQAQEAQQRQAQQQQEMQQMQQQLMQMQVDLDKYKHDSELQYKYFDSVLDAEVKEGVQLSNVQVEAAKLASGAVSSERDRQTSSEKGAADNRKAN